MMRVKYATVEEALEFIRNGQTVYVGSGAGEPRALTRALAEAAQRFWDVEVIHLETSPGDFILFDPELRRHFRYNTFCVGFGDERTGMECAADHTPVEIAQLPEAFRRGLIPVDVALVQVSPPDDLGLCSLGVSVDATRAALEAASVVVAQVNARMPVTFGDSKVPVEDLDVLVSEDGPLPETSPVSVDAVTLTVGKHVASLVEDGMTLYLDRGPACAATSRYLGLKKHLGIHTLFLTDDIVRLIKTRAVTNRKKTSHRGRTVATMVVGSGDLYAEVNENPYIELLPIDQVADAALVAREASFVAVHDVMEVDLSGTARHAGEGGYVVGGVPVGKEMMVGAQRSPGGFNVMAMRSTIEDGSRSRIVVKSDREGAYFPGTGVDFVVTEYGIAHLRGMSIRERAAALLSIAHPKFRQALLEEGKRAGYLAEDQGLPPEVGCVYPSHYEFTHTFDDGLKIFFRPVKLSDARHFQNLFYSLSPQMVRMRYHGTIKTLSPVTARQMAAVDYSQDMAIVGLVGGPNNPTVVAEGRYMYVPDVDMGEFNIVVHEDYQGRGIGKFLANYLKKIAYARGLSGIFAEVVQRNESTLALLRKAWPTATQFFQSGYCTFNLRFPPQDRRAPKDSVIVYSGRFGDFTYGEGHPFYPGRAVKTLQTIERQRHLDEPWMRLVEPVAVSREVIVETHAPEYIDALEKANDGVWRDEFAEFGLGTPECPVFPGLFDYVLTYTAATVTGANLILDEQTNIVFNPLGGFHHAGRAVAEGFCYVNDVIIAINMFLARGMRVAYIDIDAHHGNGVQDAYYDDDRVMVISLHESGKTLYPWSGFENEIGEKIGKGYTMNIPLPVGTDDECFEMLFDDLVDPAMAKFQPAVVVSTIGADTHKTDPLAQLSLTNNGMVKAVEHMREYSSHLLMLGGGGYKLETTVNAWSRMWAAANRIDALPDYLLAVGGSFMGSEGMGAEVVDMPFRVSGEAKKAIMKDLDRVMEYHQEHTLPRIREPKS